MKSSEHLICLIPFLTSSLAQGQEASKVVQKYKAAIANIESIHCQVEQIDTFVAGDTRHHNGQLTLLRNQTGSLFGFQFRSSKEVGDEALYDGLSEFQINHK